MMLDLPGVGETQGLSGTFQYLIIDLEYSSEMKKSKDAMISS